MQYLPKLQKTLSSPQIENFFGRTKSSICLPVNYYSAVSVKVSSQIICNLTQLKKITLSQLKKVPYSLRCYSV